jgi:hypothetical protein
MAGAQPERLGGCEITAAIRCTYYHLHKRSAAQREALLGIMANGCSLATAFRLRSVEIQPRGKAVTRIGP